MRDPTGGAAALVTAIIPTYRRPILLRRAVRSVLAQSMPRLRVAVYDNASGDETPQVVAALTQADPRVRYHSRTTNLGAVANAADAVSRVDTPFFSVLSDDDVLLPRFYEVALAALESDATAVFAAGQVVEMTGDGRVIKVVPEISRPRMRIEPPTGLRSVHTTLTGMLFRTTVAPEYAADDPGLDLADVDLYLRLAARYPFMLVNEVFGIFVSHAESFSHRMGVLQAWRSYEKVFARLELDAAAPETLRREVAAGMRRDLLGSVFRLGVRAAGRGELEEAEQARGLLAEYDHGGARARLLGTIVGVAGRSTAARRLLAAAYTSAWTLRNARSSRRLQRVYGGHARHLVIPPS